MPLNREFVGEFAGGLGSLFKGGDDGVGEGDVEDEGIDLENFPNSLKNVFQIY